MGGQESLHEKVIFKQNLGGNEGGNQMAIRGETFWVEKTGQCKGPGAEAHLEEQQGASVPEVGESEKSREETATTSLQRLGGHCKNPDFHSE